MAKVGATLEYSGALGVGRGQRPVVHFQPLPVVTLYSAPSRHHGGIVVICAGRQGHADRTLSREITAIAIPRLTYILGDNHSKQGFRTTSFTHSKDSICVPL